MRLNQKLLMVLTALLLVLVVGCAQYKITHELETAISQIKTCKISEISDELPAETKDEDRPSYEDIQKLKKYLGEEFDKRVIMALMGGGADIDYEIQGSILEYKKGSGWLRFLVGFGAGNAKVVINLKLVDMTDGTTVFGGNFNGTVSGWGESGDKVFQKVSKDFTKQLEKRLKKLRKELEKT